MLRHKIKEWFLEAVKLDFEMDKALRAKLLEGHPKLEGFFDRLTAEVQKAETICKTRGVKIKTKTLQDFVYDMTKMFAKGLEGENKRRLESDYQRSVREAQASKQKEFDAVLAGKAVGEFAEAGVVSNEKEDDKREAQEYKKDYQKNQSIT